MGGHWGDGSGGCLRCYPERDSGGDLEESSERDVESRIPCDMPGNSGVNPARYRRCHPEYDLLCHSHRYPERNPQDYPRSYLQGYLQDDSQGSLPDCEREARKGATSVRVSRRTSP